MPETKDALLVKQFRHFLEKGSETIKPLSNKLSLYSFYSELIALKNEIKIESRLVKQRLDRFEEIAARIEQRNQEIGTLLQKGAAPPDGANSPDTQAIIHGLIDLYDKIQASLQTVSTSCHIRPWYQWWQRSDETILLSVEKGQEMTLQRIAELLAWYGVVPMDVLSHVFDPHTMRAVGTDAIPDLEDGLVSKECRTGFILDDRMLRLADVRVNKLAQNHNQHI